MRRGRVLAAVATAAATAVLMATPASAAYATWSGEVDSGGKMKYFSTQRTTSGDVSVYVGNGPAGGVGVTLINCHDLGTAGGEKTIHEKKSGAWSSLGRKCFRLAMKRNWSADTNGILPGNGVTDVSGSITY
ncbi:hypothetical protein AB9128_03635 [Streptomyces cinereoruber]|uniref:hypothetical protein n=1 Tax=Streptomyces TaxID=1883 RepID=UPI0037FEE1B3